MSKVCARCGIEKSDDKFYKSKAHKDGLQSYCKSCDREYNKERKIKKKIERLKKEKGLNDGYNSQEDRLCSICEKKKPKEDFAVSEYNSKGGQRCRECMSKTTKNNLIKRIKRGDQ